MEHDGKGGLRDLLFIQSLWSGWVKTACVHFEIWGSGLFDNYFGQVFFCFFVINDELVLSRLSGFMAVSNKVLACLLACLLGWLAS